MKLFYVCTFLILFFLIIPYGNATEEMAEKTGNDCSYCHLDPSGGGELTKAGKEYFAEESKSDEYAQGKGILHFIRFIAGFLHILTAIFFFGINSDFTVTARTLSNPRKSVAAFRRKLLSVPPEKATRTDL